QRRLRPSEVGLSLLRPLAQLLDLSIPTIPRRRSQPGLRTGLSLLAPLRDVGGVQAFPAQDRAALAAVRRVVLGQDLRLVLRGERAPLRPVGSRSHAPIINRGTVSQGHRHRCRSYLAPCRGKNTTDAVSP